MNFIECYRMFWNILECTGRLLNVIERRNVQKLRL